jgi:lactoylglutathione lyase
MIYKLGQVMVYVNNQKEAKRFWTEKAGFHVIAEEKEGDVSWIEIAPTGEGKTSIVLHDKQKIAKMSPELNLGTPSLMFFSDDLDGLYHTFSSKDITVGKIVKTPSGRVFNFADEEDNYFAVMERR